jgi:N-acetyl sugar amidotransferase
MTFDENGVCSACQFAEHKRTGIDWDTRGKELTNLLDKYRSKDGSYDVVVPGSGGKDSATVAHKLKHEFGMHPLTVTWAPFIYTDIGFKNFYDFVQSGFDNLMCWPNGIIHRKLARLGFDLLGDAWHPFGYGQLNYAFQVASKFDIKLVFFGENGEAEYGGSSSSNDKPSFDWDDWAEVYLKGALVDDLVEKGLELGVFTSNEISEVSDFYRLPPVEELKEKDIQFHWFSYYNKWTPQENYYYARENTGFEANPDGRSEGTYSKYASLDDRTDGFHFYLAYVKFGIARATSDSAHEIRDQHITRDEAVALVKRYDGEFPKKYFKEFLDYLDISEEDFHKVVDFYRAPHLWDKIDGKWQLKDTVWNDGIE